MSIIDELWNGEVFPAEQLHPISAKYKETSQQISAAKESLLKVLSPDDAVQLETLISVMYNENDEMLKEAYRMGIRFGFQLSDIIEYRVKNRETDE